MLSIVAVSGLIGFVSGLRARLLLLMALSALVAIGAFTAGYVMGLGVLSHTLSVILGVTAFELAAFASMTMTHGLSRPISVEEPITVARDSETTDASVVRS